MKDVRKKQRRAQIRAALRAREDARSVAQARANAELEQWARQHPNGAQADDPEPTERLYGFLQGGLPGLGKRR